jgi:tetratricopeptide (TPR) repeat protein
LDNLILLGMAHASLRQIRDALAAFKQASELVRAQGLGNTQSAAVLFFRWGAMLSDFGRPLEAESLIKRYIQIAERGRPNQVTHPVVMYPYASVLEALGRLDEAASYAERLHKQTQSEFYVLWALYTQAVVARKQGNLDGATEALSKLEVQLRDHVPSGDIRFAWLAQQRALVAKARGEKTAALDLANQSVTIAEAVKQVPFGVHGDLQSSLLSRSEIELDLGDVEAALRDAQRALAILANETPPEILTMHMGAACVALGRALKAQGKCEEAQAAFRSAVKHLESALGPDHADTQAARQLAEGAVQRQ